MAKIMNYIMAPVIAALFLVGCGTTPGYYKDSSLANNWGRSLERLKQNQKAHPFTPKNMIKPTDSETGLDPKAAEAIIKKYREGFEKVQENQNRKFDFGTGEN